MRRHKCIKPRPGGGVLLLAAPPEDDEPVLAWVASTLGKRKDRKKREKPQFQEKIRRYRVTEKPSSLTTRIAEVTFNFVREKGAGRGEIGRALQKKERNSTRG